MKPSEGRARIEEFAKYCAVISVDERLDDSESGDLVAVKDNVDVAGMVTTAGGKHLPSDPGDHDAPVVAALRAAGARVIAKANMHEYAFGVTNHNVHYGVARNPHDENRVPGGSSGGSAIAVALGLCDWAMGTDTGGSIRIPAGLCGVVGVKPTNGSLSIEGIFPLAETLDIPGPMAPDVATAARALRMMRGGGPQIDCSAPAGWTASLAVPQDWEDDLDGPTAAAWGAVAGDLPRIAFPTLKSLEDVFQPILFSEATSYHLEWLRDRPEEYSEDVRSTLELGLKVSGAAYLWTMRQRERMRVEVEAALGQHDAVLVPNTQIVAPLIDEPHVRDKLLHFTRPFNLTGHPVITLPAPSAGLPVGVQVVGHHGRDDELFRVAALLERQWGSRDAATR